MCTSDDQRYTSDRQQVYFGHNHRHTSDKTIGILLTKPQKYFGQEQKYTSDVSGRTTSTLLA